MKKKHILNSILVFAVVFVLSVPLNAMAVETVLQTTIPRDFSVKLEIEGQGIVFVYNERYYNGTVAQVPRNESFSCEILPADGYEIASIIYNEERLESEKANNTLLICAKGNGILKVIFSPIMQTPQTADSTNIYMTVMVMLVALSVFVGIQIYRNVKRKEQL